MGALRRDVGPAVLGFSSPSGPGGLVEPGADIVIERVIQRGLFRGERLEIHPSSAKAFDMQSGHAGLEPLFEGMEPVCLAVFPSVTAGAGVRFKFASRVMPLHMGTLQTGGVIKMTLRNVSDAPARFRANLIGVRSES